jgi:hypothetical protein
MSIHANQTIHFAGLDNEILYRPTPYMLRKEPKRFAWLARACWKLLHRLNALEMYSEKVQTWTYTEAAQETLTKMVMMMRESLWEASEHPDRWVVVCGAKDFHEAVNAPEFRDAMTFSVGPFGRSIPYRQMFNMDVHVVPHLTGIAVIPRAIVEKVAAA